MPLPASSRLAITGCLAASLACAGGCSSASLPDPRQAADAFARAAERGDADSIYEMMTTSAKNARSREDVERLVAEQRPELAERAKALRANDTRIEAAARLRFADGEEAHLELRGGRFWVTAAGTLPGGGKTPEQALDQLRRVLARRSYAGLIRVLTPATRAAVEADLRSMVVGLERPETLRVEEAGDTATVKVPGGHAVRLKRDGEVWRVDDLE